MPKKCGLPQASAGLAFAAGVIMAVACGADAREPLGTPAVRTVTVSTPGAAHAARGNQPPATPAPGDLLVAPIQGSHVKISAQGGRAQTSEYMAGQIVYTVVFVDSMPGSGHCSPADQDLESWDPARMDRVLAEISAGLDFWLTRSGRPSNLSFIQENWGVRPTSCEPIAHPANGLESGEGLWMEDVLTTLGVDTTRGDHIAAANAFAQSRRASRGADWAFTVFVVDSLNDEDGCFAGSACGEHCDIAEKCLSAYAHLNGPYMVMTWDNGDWGIDNMRGVMAHETGHVFGAGDEYSTLPGEPGCSTADTHGYLNAPNTSCNNGGNTNDISIMAGFDEVTNPNVDVSESARHAIGWRNPRPGEAGATVVDVISRVEAGYTEVPGFEAPRTPCFFAIASAAPTATGGKNTNGRLHAPSSAAEIQRVEWNIDGGPFLPAVAFDGQLDEPLEDYYFAPSTELKPGKHTVGTRAINDFGAASLPAYLEISVTYNKMAGTTPRPFNVENCRHRPTIRPP